MATPVLSVSIKGEPEAVYAAVESLAGVTDVQITEGENGTTDVVLTCEKGVDIKEPLALAMLQNGCLILRLEESRASLEDVFMELISQQPEITVPLPTDETLEVDAQALLDGAVGSAYDAHEAFDAPPRDSESGDDEALPDDGTTDVPDTSEDAVTVTTDEPVEPLTEQTEGGENDVSNV